MPLLIAVLQDTPEGQLLAGLYNSSNGSRPCKFCCLSGQHFNDVHASGRSRKFTEDAGIRRRQIANLKAAQEAGARDGSITAARDKLKAESCKACPALRPSNSTAPVFCLRSVHIQNCRRVR
jgi:hypothetical protein